MVLVLRLRVNWPINWVEKSQLQASTASEAPLPSFLTSLVVKIKLKTPLQNQLFMVKWILCEISAGKHEARQQVSYDK